MMLLIMPNLSRAGNRVRIISAPMANLRHPALMLFASLEALRSEISLSQSLGSLKRNKLSPR
jgi:hypothetical protein